MRKALIDGAWLGALALVCLSVVLRAAPASLIDAATRDDKEAVRRLLKSGADVNSGEADGMTALHYAALGGDAELAAMLLYAGANPEAATRLGAYTPLMMAAGKGD